MVERYGLFLLSFGKSKLVMSRSSHSIAGVCENIIQDPPHMRPPFHFCLRRKGANTNTEQTKSCPFAGCPCNTARLDGVEVYGRCLDLQQPSLINIQWCARLVNLRVPRTSSNITQTKFEAKRAKEKITILKPKRYNHSTYHRIRNVLLVHGSKSAK